MCGYIVMCYSIYYNYEYTILYTKSVTSGGESIPSTSTQGGGVASAPSSSSLSGGQDSVGCMAYIREGCQKEELSEQASSLVLASWRSKSNSNYNSHFHKLECWCYSRDRNPISGPIADVFNFLAELYEQGYQYCSINSYCSAISSVHEKVDGYQIGQHPMVSRMLRGVFNSRPPQPCYKSTWKVSTVLDWISSETMSIKSLLFFINEVDHLISPFQALSVSGLGRISIIIS